MKLKTAPVWFVLVAAACGSSTEKTDVGDASAGVGRDLSVAAPADLGVVPDLSPSGPGCSDGGVNLVTLPDYLRAGAGNAYYGGYAPLYVQFQNLCDVSRLEYALGTTSGGDEVLPFTMVDLSNLATDIDASSFPTNGGTYYVTGRFTDTSGRVSLSSSEPFVFDHTLAVIGPITASATTTSMCASWSGSDPESGILKYEYSIDTFGGGQGILPRTPAGLATSVCVGNLTLVSGHAYYFTVFATNGTGYVQLAWTPQVYVP